MISKRVIVAVAIIVIALVTFVYVKPSFLNEVFHNTVIEKTNPYVKEYSLPDGSYPNGLIVDKKGFVWVAPSKNGTLLSLDPKTGEIKSHEIRNESVQDGIVNASSTMVWTMVQDSDGKIWFSPLGTKSIWRFDPTNGNFDMYKSETGAPFQMKVGRQGEIWFTTLRGDTIGVVEKSHKNIGYKISSFETGNNTNPAGIFLQDDSVWVANVGSKNIVQYKIILLGDSVNNVSVIQSIPKNNFTLFSSPTDLLADKGVVWLTEHDTSFLTKYDLNTGKTTRYPTSQNYFHTTTLPFWIRGTENPKILWFNEHQGNKIAYFDLSHETLTEYGIPSVPKGGYLTYSLNISEDPRDEKILWFSEWNTDKVGVIDGNIPVPFEISTADEKITLSSNKTESTIDFEVKGTDQYNSNHLFLNASSSITSTAELGNLTVMFSQGVVDLSHTNKVQLFVRNDGVPPGNYTIGISASDGFVTKTKFLDLSILSR